MSIKKIQESKHYRRIAFNKFHKWCGVCGETKKLEIHHRDGNRKNNKMGNLVILCHKHHKLIHNIFNIKRKINKKYQPGTKKCKRK